MSEMAMNSLECVTLLVHIDFVCTVGCEGEAGIFTHLLPSSWSVGSHCFLFRGMLGSLGNVLGAW
jgi:hypothetical protein